MSEEKRTFSRVPIRLKGHARIMQAIESPQIFTGDIVGDSTCRDNLFRNSKLPEDLTNFLTEMDRKLDRVLGLLSKETLQNDFPIDIEVLELSAAGVKFRSKTKIETNESLEIVLILSQVPLRMAGSKGRIHGIEDDTKLYRFEFVDTRGSDMEAIVQFVFQQQREQIRNSKM
ncbi:MAG: PilZ domain-containing protein [Pseudodesulfovibrio sp.]